MTQLKYFLHYITEVFLNQRERFILCVPILMAIGVGGYFSLDYEPPLWGSLTCLFVLTVLLSFTRSKPLYNGIILALFLVVLGFTSAGLRTAKFAAPMLEKKLGPVMVIGTVVEVDALPESKGWRIILSDLELDKLDEDKIPARIRVQIYKKAIDNAPLPGQRVSVLSILNAPSPPVIPEAFDFRRYMFFEAIGGTGFAIGKLEVLASDTIPVSSFKEFWEKRRIYAREKIANALSENYIVSSLVTALLTGERREITDDTWNSIRSAGLAHLLAISGLHIGLVAGLLFFSIRALLALSEYISLNFSIKKISAAIALMGTIIYLLLVGAPVSAQRATIMTGIVLIAVMMDREGMTLRLAAVAASVILLIMPEALLGAGFHMSFAAVISLIAFYEALSPYWREWHRNASFIHRMALYLLASIFTTVISSLATAPLSLYHFHYVSDEMSLLANILAVPITSFIVMPAGLVALILMPFGGEYIPLQVMGVGVEAIYDIAHDITNRGDHVIYTPAWSLTSLLWMVGGGLWLAVWRGKLRLWGIIPIIFGIVLAVQSVDEMSPDIYIADNGRVMALRLSDGTFALSSTRKEKFVTENWRRRATQEDIKPEQWPKNGSINENFTCDWLACSWNKAGYKIVFVRNPIAFVKFCNGIDVLIAAKNVIPKTCKVKYKIGRFDLWDKGAHILYIDKGSIKIVTVAEKLGDRYWVLDRYKSRNEY